MYKHAVTIYLFINDTSILTGYYIIISQEKIQVIKNLVQWLTILLRGYFDHISDLYWLISCLHVAY